jgi:hypothetical protein
LLATRALLEDFGEKEIKIMLLVKQLTILNMNCFGFFGFILISYSIISILTSSAWLPLESIDIWISQCVTPLATLLVVVSIYLPINTMGPDVNSNYFIALLVIITIIMALGYMAKKKKGFMRTYY